MKWEKTDGTFWLPREVLNTFGNAKLVGDNETNEEQIVTEYLEDWFLADRARQVCCFTITDLIDSIDWGYRKPDRTTIKVFLREKLGAIEPGHKANRVNKGEHYLIAGSDRADKPGKYMKIFREQLQIEVDIFNDVRI